MSKILALIFLFLPFCFGRNFFICDVFENVKFDGEIYFLSKFSHEDYPYEKETMICKRIYSVEDNLLKVSLNTMNGKKNFSCENSLTIVYEKNENKEEKVWKIIDNWCNDLQPKLNKNHKMIIFPTNLKRKQFIDSNNELYIENNISNDLPSIVNPKVRSYFIVLIIIASVHLIFVIYGLCKTSKKS